MILLWIVATARGLGTAQTRRVDEKLIFLHDCRVDFVQGYVFHAAEGFLHHLLEEVPSVTRIDGELVSSWNISGGPPFDLSSHPVFWTRNTWRAPFLLEFGSISEAARALKSLQRNWSPVPFRCARRTILIAEQLPHFSVKPHAFPFLAPEAPMGSFTLLDEHLLLGSARCTSPFPNGVLEFEENKDDPPSRAYRKLWEALVLAGQMPQPGERCIDAGASPGGWTWVLASLGASVLSIDRAPLEPRIAKMPNVEWQQHDAFTLKPQDIGPVDWLCSDVICYPEALWLWVSKWLESGLARNYICTIKMQGDTYDRATTLKFASVPGSRVVHLWHNKHELTWIKLASWG